MLLVRKYLGTKKNAKTYAISLQQFVKLASETSANANTKHDEKEKTSK